MNPSSGPRRESAGRICVLAVIQARMGSERFPGKMTQRLGGRRLIDWVLTRVSAAASVDTVVLAVPSGRADDVLADIAAEHTVPVVRGPEADVLGRIALAHRLHPSDHVMRICADNPFVAREEVDRLVATHLRSGTDYTFNHIPSPGNDYADGLGAEIVTADTLVRLDREATLPYHREHVTAYIWAHPDRFQVRAVAVPPELAAPGIRLDVDTADDLERLRRLPCLDDVMVTPRELLDASGRIAG